MKNFGYRSAAQRKKNLRYGGYSTVVTLVVLVVAIIVTVLFEQLDLTVDLSANKMYTPSDATEKVLDEIEDEVAIYGLYSTGQEELTYYAGVIRLMEQYARLSDKVTYETIDILKDPNFMNDYKEEGSVDTAIGEGSVIIQNKESGKYRLLTLDRFYGYTNTDNPTIDAFTAEEALTSAIQYVTAGHTPVLYELQGHNETSLTSAFKKFMLTTNYDFKTMNIMTEGIEKIEANSYTVLLLNKPTVDLEDKEFEILRDFMAAGGSLLVMLDYSTPNDMPNLEALLERYGITYEAGGQYVQETEISNYYQRPYLVWADISEESEITSSMAADPNLSIRINRGAALFVKKDEELNRKTQITPLLSSSDTAILGDGENVSETKAPYIYAIAVEEENTTVDFTVTTSRLVVFSNGSFIDTTNNNFMSLGNYKFASACLSYLQEEIDDLYITAKSLVSDSITVTAADFVTGFAIFVFILPAALIITGVVIWVRRKHL